MDAYRGQWVTTGLLVAHEAEDDFPDERTPSTETTKPRSVSVPLNVGLVTVRPHGSRPWSVDDLLRLSIAGGVAFGLVIAGWFGASRATTASTQLGWLNLSLLGLVMAGGANGLWLARVRRRLAIARAGILPWSVMSAPKVRTHISSRALVAVRGTSRYHTRDCLLVAGKEVQGTTARQHQQEGRMPCEVCEP